MQQSVSQAKCLNSKTKYLFFSPKLFIPQSSFVFYYVGHSRKTSSADRDAPYFHLGNLIYLGNGILVLIPSLYYPQNTFKINSHSQS